MLRSFAALLGRVDTPARLAIVGDGPLAAPLRRLSLISELRPVSSGWGSKMQRVSCMRLTSLLSPAIQKDIR